jgi:hypothetical protein
MACLHVGTMPELSLKVTFDIDELVCGFVSEVPVFWVSNVA